MALIGASVAIMCMCNSRGATNSMIRNTNRSLMGSPASPALPPLTATGSCSGCGLRRKRSLTPWHGTMGCAQ